MRTVLALSLALPLAVLMVLAARWQEGVPHSQASATAIALRGTEVFPPRMHPGLPFALRDQNGHRIRLVDLRGSVTVLTFLDSHCTQECPVAGRQLAQTQRLLGRHSPMVVVVVSVNPGHDTPASARAFMRKSGIGGRWHWLLGSQRSLASVWTEYGIQVQPGKGDITHTAALYLIDKHGSVRVADSVPFAPIQLAGSVLALARG